MNIKWILMVALVMMVVMSVSPAVLPALGMNVAATTPGGGVVEAPVAGASAAEASTPYHGR